MRPDAPRALAARRGSVLLYALALMMLLLGGFALAVDVARLQLARTELQQAVDAAALHAAAGTGDDWRERYRQAIGDNRVGGRLLTEQEVELQTGQWDPALRRFEASASGEAMRLQGRAAVPMLFAALLGVPSVDVTAAATITGRSPGPNLVGIDGVSMASGARIDSYDSSAGPTATGMARVDLASNGNISLANNSRIHGNVWHGPGGSASGRIDGTVNVLSDPLNFPPVDPEGYGPTRNDNARIPSQFLVGGDLVVGQSTTLDLPAGTYYVKDLQINSSSELRVQGPTVIYVTGNLRFHAASRTGPHRPADLEFRVIGNGTVDLECGKKAQIYGVIYAPQSLVRIDSNSSLYGTVIGKELVLRSGGTIHYDESLPSRMTTSVHMVQ